MPVLQKGQRSISFGRIAWLLLVLGAPFVPSKSEAAVATGECKYQGLSSKPAAIPNPLTDVRTIQVEAKNVQTTSGSCAGKPVETQVKGRNLYQSFEDAVNQPGAYLIQQTQANGNLTTQAVVPPQVFSRAGSNVRDFGEFVLLFFTTHEGVPQVEYRTRVTLYLSDGSVHHLDHDNAQSHALVMSCLRHPRSVPSFDPSVGFRCLLQ